MSTFAEKILHSAEEGIVLLKNENQALPLSKDDKISVFGRIQYEFYRCGTGSGGSVHVPYITNLTDSLKALSEECGFSINEELCLLYQKFIEDNPFDNGGGLWAAEPWSQKEMEISPELAAKASENSGKAVYVVGRTSGEDKDYQTEKGSWYLTDLERRNICELCKVFDDVIIVFNCSGIIDTIWTEDAEFGGKIRAIVYAWQGGQESGRACANILAGTAVPCGKLTDTIAKSIDDYPSTEEFAKKQCFYKEDIFVGYRFFNTFAKEKILYPFGFGISYTDFALSNIQAKNEGTKVSLTVDVENIGKKFAGKEIVQVYISAPQGKLGKSAVELAAFGKTRLLSPSQKDTLTLSFDLEDFASYDDEGATGFEFCGVLEKGEYKVLVGTDSLSAKQIKVSGQDSIKIQQTYVVEKLEQAAAPLIDFERITTGNQNADGTFSIASKNTPLYKVDIASRIRQNLPAEIKFTGNKNISFDDVKKDRALLDPFVAQLTVKELATMVRGEGMLSRKVTPGIAAAYGGLSDALHEYKIPCAGCADGPSGMRLDNGGEGSLMPIGTQLACSWNLELIRELFEEEGKELAEHEIDTLLGPGINIHRNPLNGRNFEYFSEDPLLTGLIAKNQIQGLYDGGSNATIKHLALNSQETLRRTTESVVSERAMREIYLKPFEISVRAGVLKSIMTSYNVINGHWAAGNYDLVNTILRREWGYKGMVMTDWWASMNDCVKGGEPSMRDVASMVRSRGDTYMVVDNNGAEKNLYEDNLEASLENGNLTLGELQACVKDVLNFLLDAPVSKRPLRPLVNIVEYEPVEISGSNNIKEEEHFVPVIDEPYILTVENEGIFGIFGSYLKVEDELSQSTTNIFINGKPAGSFECRTTLGKCVWANANHVKLKKGKYEILISHRIGGIEIKDFYFTSKGFNPVTIS